MPERKIINHQGFEIEYFVFGNGTNTLIALHGHAKSAEDFFFLEDDLKDYTIIAINLFFHGNSKMPDDRDYSLPLRIEEWKGLIHTLFEREEITTFSLLAYSLGGRWGFNLIQHFPEKVEHIVFMAPDGLNKNGWYHRTAGSRILRSIFKRVVEKPKTFLAILKFIRSIRIISRRLYHFLLFHLETEEKRKKAYRTWMMYRYLFPDHQKVHEFLKKHNSKKYLILGKYDAIISPKHSKKFIKRNEGVIEVQFIDCGHDFFKPKYLSNLKTTIKNILA